MTPKSEMSKDSHGNQMPQMGSAILDTYLQFITENYGKSTFVTYNSLKQSLSVSI